MTDYLICKSHELISHVILETITNTMINYQNLSEGIDRYNREYNSDGIRVQL